MPVFTQICSADPVADPAVVGATCTCGCDMLMDTDNDLADRHNSIFIYIANGRHLPSCALVTAAAATNSIDSTSTTTSSSTGNGKNVFSLLKQQQQQKLVGGLLLRKPPASSLRRRFDPFAPVRVQPSRSSHLYAGSRFTGKQKSGSSSYDVMVDIKDVNLEDSSLCGYLHINGLTEEYPELTTFFDAEIIGNVHSFVTEKWEADVKTDRDHWNKFEPFAPLVDNFENKAFQYDFRNKDVIFMRWKEHFLVPDHRVQGIHGASFAGFYYICYNKITGVIDGYYFHRSSER